MRNYAKKTSFMLAAIIMIVLPVFVAGPSSAKADETCRNFSETGHTVCGKFLSYWDSHGGLAQQGYPISDQISEKSDVDGKMYTMQYFERAVFELHPENQPPYDVLLSLLGVSALKAKNAPQPSTSMSCDCPAPGGVDLAPTDAMPLNPKDDQSITLEGGKWYDVEDTRSEPTIKVDGTGRHEFYALWIPYSDSLVLPPYQDPSGRRRIWMFQNDPGWMQANCHVRQEAQRFANEKANTPGVFVRFGNEVLLDSMSK